MKWETYLVVVYYKSRNLLLAIKIFYIYQKYAGRLVRTARDEFPRGSRSVGRICRRWRECMSLVETGHWSTEKRSKYAWTGLSVGNGEKMFL